MQVPVFLNKDFSEDLKEIAYIMKNMRYWQQKWHNEFGYQNKMNKQYWEQKADNWIKKNTQ